MIASRFWLPGVLLACFVGLGLSMQAYVRIADQAFLKLDRSEVQRAIIEAELKGVKAQTAVAALVEHAESGSLGLVVSLVRIGETRGVTVLNAEQSAITIRLYHLAVHLKSRVSAYDGRPGYVFTDFEDVLFSAKEDTWTAIPPGRTRFLPLNARTSVPRFDSEEPYTVEVDMNDPISVLGDHARYMKPEDLSATAELGLANLPGFAPAGHRDLSSRLFSSGEVAELLRRIP